MMEHESLVAKCLVRIGVWTPLAAVRLRFSRSEGMTGFHYQLGPAPTIVINRVTVDGRNPAPPGMYKTL